MAKLQLSPRFFLLPVLGLCAAACSSDDNRSEVIVDLTLGTGVSSPQTVHVSATQNGVEVKTFEVAWQASNAGLVHEAGLYFPSTVTGQVTIAATAYVNSVATARGQIAEAVALVKGEAIGPYALVLNALSPSGNDGGVLDGSVDQGTSDAGATGAEAGEVAPTPSPDAGLVDPALDGAAGDTVGSNDVPLTSEDAPAVDAPYGDANPDDATGEVGHTLAWEPAVNVQSDLKTSYGTVVAIDPINENVYAAWVDDTTIKVRRWTRQTATWEKTVTVENRGNPNTPGIGVDVKGNVMLVWPQDTKGVNTSLDGVWMSRSTDGASWSPPVRISAGVAYGVVLAVARNGAGHAAYSKKGNGTWSLVTAYYDGTVWTESAKPVEPESNYADFEPRIALSALGDGLMIYGKGWGVAGTVLTGTTFTEPLMLDPKHESVAGYDPALAVNRKGEGLVVWTESTGGSTVMLGRTYSPATSWSSPTPPIVTEDTVGTPAVALDEQGNITLVWQQYLASGGFNLVGMHGKLDGTWSDVAILETENRAGSSSTKYNTADPTMAVDGNGNVLVVWRKDLSEGKTATIGAYGTRYAAGTWSPQAKVALKTGLDVPYLSLVVADSGVGALTFRYIDINETGTTDPDSYQTMVALFR